VHIVRFLYDWVLSWAGTPYGSPALFSLAFAESSFFPIPPDVLLIALCMGAPSRFYVFCFICSVGSVIGGMFGYLIGYKFYDLFGEQVFRFIAKLCHSSPDSLYNGAKAYYDKYGVWAVGIAGFTPIPYKIFTITAGLFRMNFPKFCLASGVSRSARFFLVGSAVGLLFKYYGPAIEQFIDKYFNLLTLIFVILLIGGFLVIRYLIPKRRGGNFQV
jgi:membrane protein YqaA with SNARE-associated domain